MGTRNVNLESIRWQNWSLGLKGAAVIALPITLLLVSLYSNYALQRDVSRADEEVQRTLTIRGDIQTLHTLIAEAASGVRGYMLTGREEFLSPYWMAQDRIPPTLAKLRTLIRDPEQAATFAKAEELATAKLATLEGLRRDGAQLQPEALQARLRAGKSVLDALRAQIAALTDREVRLLAERSAAASVARRRELIANVAMAAIGLAGAGVALWLLSSSIIRRVRTAATNAERLASGMPLVEPPAAGDELGELAERLHRASLLLAERAEQARAASRAKTEFLSRTSHELRTPLNVILGFAQLLETDLRGTPSAASVAQVLGAGRHLLALIDEMLDVARIEAGEIKLQAETVSLAPLLREVETLVAPLAAKAAVRLEFDAVGELAVRADRQRLLQVLLNLLTNAVKFNRTEGLVRVTAERAGDRVCIAVADTGSGIAPEHLGRLFAPFERLDAERRGVQGTGLGLAISHQFMKRMRGTIEVESEVGRGSVFRLLLDAADLAQSPPEIAVAVPEPERANDVAAAFQALYVDDDRQDVALMHALFARRARWRLQVARTGDDALRLARDSGPDLILLGLRSSGTPADAILHALGGDSPLRPARVVAFGTNVPPTTLEQLRSLGVTECLPRPIELRRLHALLDQIET